MTEVDAFVDGAQESPDGVRAESAQNQALDGDGWAPRPDPGFLDQLLGGTIWLREELQRRRTQLARLGRYTATSAVAFGVSEATLLVLYGSGIANATVDAAIANLVGTVPSYFMSRFWIWKDADRSRVGRQVLLYWMTSFVCLALTSLATGAIASIAPAGHHYHLAVVAIGFPVVTIVFWLVKLVVYQRYIFPVRPRHERAAESDAGPVTGELVSEHLGRYGTPGLVTPE